MSIASPIPRCPTTWASNLAAIERREAELLFLEALPPEIAFLSSFGVAPGPLLEAAETAKRTAVTADVALLASGAVSEAAFYRALARRLGVAQLDDEIAVAPIASAAQTIAAGMAPVAPNALGIRFVLAPRGATIAALLETRRSRDRPAPYAIVSPRRFAAAVRQAQAVEIATDAVRDLIVDGKNLSARFGPSLAQAVFLAALSPILVFCAVMLPTMTSLALSLPILLAIVVRLTAIGVGRPPRPAAATRRTRDADLPVYTILVPLYREARVAAKLVRFLDRLDYPVLCSKHTLTEIAHKKGAGSEARRPT